MIESYLNQTCLWHKAVGKNAYAETIYEPAVEIKVRWEGKTRKIITEGVEKLTPGAEVTMLAAVKAGDKLYYEGREWIIASVEPVVMFDGSVSHRVVQL